MRLGELVRPEQVAVELKSKEKAKVLDELAELLSRSENPISAGDFYRVLTEREKLRSTGVGSGVAIPHGKVTGLEKLTLAVGLSKEGVDFDAADDRPVHIFMALAAPVSSTGDHLRALARIARICSDAEFREELLGCSTDEEAYAALVREDEKHAHA